MPHFLGGEKNISRMPSPGGGGFHSHLLLFPQIEELRGWGHSRNGTSPETVPSCTHQPAIASINFLAIADPERI